jgi:hypothetical protein
MTGEAKIRVRQKTEFSCPINVIWVVQSPLKKYFAFAVGQIISTDSRAVPPR